MSTEETTPTPEIAGHAAEAALARAELAGTLDALVDRVDPRRQAERAKEKGRRLVFDATDPAALPEDRARARKIAAAAGVVVALVVVGIVRRIAR